MKAIRYIFASLTIAATMTACQDKDVEKAAPVLAPVSAESITGSLQGDDYVWTWSGVGNAMQVAVYNGSTLSSSYDTVTADEGITDIKVRNLSRIW